MRSRGPVVYLNRAQKAQMICSVIEDFLKQPVKGLQTLDIGCGNGEISQFLARGNNHFAVDVKDQRSGHNKGAFAFVEVFSEILPFRNDSFDVVVSHHVIEHVGDQNLHLSEIYRVLRPVGIAYIATPNKSSPFMEGHVNNSMVLRHSEMQPLWKAHGFESTEYSTKVAKFPSKFHCEYQFGRYLPVPILNLMRVVFPSHIFMLRKRNSI